MYSDSSGSDSETDPYAFKVGRRSTAWPYLRLYEQEELEAKYHEWKVSQDMRRDGLDISDIQLCPTRGMYRIFKVRRFLDSVKGFYTGSLDLSGRHLDRFESLSIRWKSFQEDYLQMIRAGYGFQSSEWERFRTKWRIPKSIFREVRSLFKELFIDLNSLPKSPKIQRICLVHLPPEVLDMIFTSSFGSYGIRDVRSLSSTCKLLREIGMPFIFRHQILTLNSPNWDMIRWKEEGKTFDEIHRLASQELGACRGKLQYSLEFLLGRPSIVETFKYLSVNDRLAALIRQYEVPSSVAVYPPNFYDNIWYMLSKILLRAVNLRTLDLTSMQLTEGIMHAVISLPHLTSVEMTKCHIPRDVVEKMISGEFSPSQSVMNFNVLDEKDSSEGAAWDFVSFFSNLRTLSVSRFAEDFTPLPGPSEDVIQNHNLFSTLQKLIIRPQMNPEDFLDLSRWIRSCAMRAPLQLTHLKLTTRIWLEEELIVPLLDALRTAPMQVLVLDGIKEASLDLFDRIAACCPQLLGLTVTKRENISQRRGYLARWPHPSWEYASRFSAFHRLEHFTWNFWINPYNEVSPSSMLYLEAGFITGNSLQFITDIEDYMDDAHCLAYPFAANCPTLRSFAVNFGITEQYECFCYIDRMSTGTIVLRPINYSDHRATHLLHKWDIPVNKHHWPSVLKAED